MSFPFSSAQALSVTEVSTLAEAITVRIDGQNSGSGVLIKQQDNTYTVLTAAHVVATEDEYEVITSDNQRYPFTYSQVKKFPDVDLALVEFTSTQSYPVVELGDSTQIKAGESIFVSGFPMPTAAITESIWNFSKGEVTANAKRPLADGYGLVYSNNTLPGMSGGAVLDSQGKLIGIHGRADAEQQVQKTETVYVKTGFNLGIPINTFITLAAKVTPQLGFVSQGTEPKNMGSSADDWYLQARNKFKRGDYQGAITDFNQAINLNPKYQEAFNGRGIAYSKLKDYSQALADFEEAIALEPDGSKKVYYNRALTYSRLKQHSPAIADYSKAIAFNPRNGKAYNNRGTSYKAIREYENAIADYTKAIAIDAKDFKAYYNRGLTYYALRQFPQALADYDQAIALEPRDAVAYNNRGNIYFALKDYPNAIADFDKAIRFDQNYVDGYFNRGNAYDVIKEYPKALADYAKVIELDPGYAAVYNNRGNTYKALKDYPNAIADFDQAINLKPSNGGAYFNRGILHAITKKFALAKQDFQMAAKLFKQQKNPVGYRKSIQALKRLK
ncbi:tetratricopeptide repeat-containing serine protease family protein [Acaryochloris sp. IP29b_bin.137]|uniref:tetratricopeptide repeat-containing S1 family peptidase n=1 Tax=Acaryochloris sp. IP29b_bin.137 TaxID=2969217 RepID=UPI00260DBDDA|nr:tetratricopeptide repeat-containing serine protease family protein [Acaryochloris sp. IP29b_bin.137]